MVRISAIFIAVCMVLIGASLGAVLFLVLHVSAAMSAIAALAALTAMGLFNTISTRLRDRHDLGDQIADLSRGTADLARQVGELSRKSSMLEQRLENSLTRARGASDPLAAEIGELGNLVKQLAETVAAHETEIYRRTGANAGSPAVLALPPEAAATPQAAPETAPEAETPAASVGERGFAGVPREALGSMIVGAVDAGRIDLYLQPIVTLPQRKVRFYEAMSRLRTEQGDVVPASDFIEYAEVSGLMPKIDNLSLVRCVQVMRRLQLKNREVGLFCNISASTLSNAESFHHFLEFAEANRALASSLVFEFSQRAYRNFSPLEYEALAALADRGYRF
ncbi:MAG: EAL domain-containing protein, partial [Pseudolabrys sp.]|nr:EAL domain-containing protein [Pseudolabrys sp.]